MLSLSLGAFVAFVGADAAYKRSNLDRIASVVSVADHKADKRIVSGTPV